MKYPEIRQAAYAANLQLPELRLVLFTFGNASAADREAGVFATELGGIVHTHSTYATAWAQAQLPIPIMGTTHADHLTVDVPCAPPMEDARIKGNYEYETGRQIIDHFRESGHDPADVEMILVGNHGPFTWGKDVNTAVYNAAVLEEVARMACLTRQINPAAPRLKDSLVQKHWQRKHGKDAYYGQ